MLITIDSGLGKKSSQKYSESLFYLMFVQALNIISGEYKMIMVVFVKS